MIQRPTIREKCAWVRSNTWRDERPVATGLDRFFSVFRFFDKHRNWQPKKFRICATATGGPVFCGCVQSDFGLFSSPANWTCKHYPHVFQSEFEGPWPSQKDLHLLVTLHPLTAPPPQPRPGHITWHYQMLFSKIKIIDVQLCTFYRFLWRI